MVRRAAFQGVLALACAALLLLLTSTRTPAQAPAAAVSDVMKAAIADREALPPAEGSLWRFEGPRNLQQGEIDFGLSPYSGRINEVAVHPLDAQIIYATGATGGLWKSTDGGEQWASRSAGWPTQGATAVALDPNRPNRVFVGTGDYKRLDHIPPFSVGVMRSLDGGLAWEAFGTDEMRHYAVSRIVIDPVTSDTILAAAGRGSRLPGGDVFRSVDAGVTWSPTSVPDANWDDLELCADDMLWASASRRKDYDDDNDPENLSGLVYRSPDMGVTWSKVTLVAGAFNLDSAASPDVVHVACDPAASAVFVAVYQNTEVRVFRTINLGSNWTEMTAAPVAVGRNAWAHSALGVASGFLFVGSVEVFRAALVATPPLTFTQLVGLHSDIQCVVRDPAGEQRFYLCHDGGLYRHSASADSTESLSATLGVTQAFRMDVHRRHGGLIGIGTQDLGDPISFFGNGNDAAALRKPPNWGLVLGGDGRSSAFKHESNSKMYLGITNGAIARYDGAARVTLQTSAADDSQGPLLFSGDTLLYADRSLLKLSSPDSKDAAAGTADWRTILFRPVGNRPRTIQSLAVCPTDPAVMYAGSSIGELFYSDTVGESWTEIDRDGLPADVPIWAISPSPANCRDVLIALGYEGIASVRTGDNRFHPGDRLMRNPDVLAAGAWTGAHGGAQRLPRAPVFAILRHPTLPSFWFVAGDAGVFRTDDGGATWTNATGPLGLPNTHVRDLRISADGNTLYAATFGRGVWSMDISRPAADVFSVRGTVTFGGRPVDRASVVIEGAGRIRKWLKNTLTDGASVTTAPIVVDESATITEARATLQGSLGAAVSLITPTGAELPMTFTLPGGRYVLTGGSASALIGQFSRGSWRFKVTVDRGDAFVQSGSVDFSFTQRVSNLTGPDGEYTIEFVKAGTHSMSVFDCDCAPASIVVDGHETGVDFALNPDVGIAARTAKASESGAVGAFEVTRAGSASNPLTVAYTVTGSAAAGADYVPLSGSVVIPAGSTSAIIPVTAMNDTRDEDVETVVVRLTPGVGYTVAVPSQATVGILDNDPAPTVSIGNTSVLEGGTAFFTVSLSQASGKSVSVDFTTSPGTAQAGFVCGVSTDYLTRSGTRTVTPGITSLTISVPTCADLVAEISETFTVQLSNPQEATFATGPASIGSGTILNSKTGTFELEPAEAAVAVDERLRYELTWTVPAPRNWHDLKSVDLRVGDGRSHVLWVRFFETNNTVALFDPVTGRFGAHTALGVDGRLENSTAVLHLKESAVTGSGPTGPSVTLALVVSFKAPAAGRDYMVQAAATADNGDHDRFVKAGLLSVR